MVARGARASRIEHDRSIQHPWKRCSQEPHPERVPERLKPSKPVSLHCHIVFSTGQMLGDASIWHPVRGAVLEGNAVPGGAGPASASDLSGARTPGYHLRHLRCRARNVQTPIAARRRVPGARRRVQQSCPRLGRGNRSRERGGRAGGRHKVVEHPGGPRIVDRGQGGVREARGLTPGSA